MRNMAQEGSQNTQKKPVPWLWIISGLVVLLVAAGFGLKALDGAFTYYIQADEFVDHRDNYNGKNLKIAGYVEKDSLKKEGKDFHFNVNFQGRSFPVLYSGLVPDTFKEGVEVVVEGRESKDRSVFLAKNLMAKCASKYEVGGMPKLQEQSSPPPM